MNRRGRSIASIVLVVLAIAGSAARADDEVAAFYTGKTVQMMVRTSPGGGVDQTGGHVPRHVQQHIPGKPNNVVQEVPGAGGKPMANHLFASGARDGTMIGAALNGMPSGPVLTPK